MIKLTQVNEDLEHLGDELKSKVVVALDDTAAQVALEADDKRKEVKKDTKSAIDSTNELAKKTNADGKAREIFESFEEGETLEIRPETLEDFGINSAITQLIKDAWENVDKINSYIVTFNDDLTTEQREILQDIIDDNMIHVTRLETLIK